MTELSHNACKVLDNQVRAVYLNQKHYNKKVAKCFVTVCKVQNAKKGFQSAL